MTSNNLNRKVGGESFNYGNHRIEITVRLVNESVTLFDDCMNSRSKNRDNYCRVVDVEAIREGSDEVEVKNSLHVVIDETAYRERKAFSIPILGEVLWQSAKVPPELDRQIEEATRPVFEELDEIYQFTVGEIDVSVEVGIQRVENEMSWVDVEDEIDRISREIDEISEV